MDRVLYWWCRVVLLLVWEIQMDWGFKSTFRTVCGRTVNYLFSRRPKSCSFSPSVSSEGELYGSSRLVEVFVQLGIWCAFLYKYETLVTRVAVEVILLTWYPDGCYPRRKKYCISAPHFLGVVFCLIFIIRLLLCISKNWNYWDCNGKIIFVSKNVQVWKKKCTRSSVGRTDLYVLKTIQLVNCDFIHPYATFLFSRLWKHTAFPWVIYLIYKLLFYFFGH